MGFAQKRKRSGWRSVEEKIGLCQTKWGRAEVRSNLGWKLRQWKLATCWNLWSSRAQSVEIVSRGQLKRECEGCDPAIPENWEANARCRWALPREREPSQFGATPVERKAERAPEEVCQNCKGIVLANNWKRANQPSRKIRQEVFSLYSSATLSKCAQMEFSIANVKSARKHYKRFLLQTYFTFFWFVNLCLDKSYRNPPFYFIKVETALYHILL